MNKRYLRNGIIVLLGLLLVVFLAVQVIPQILVTLTRAKPTGIVDFSQSYILGSKIMAKADGTDSCVVNVFVADKNGIALPNKKIELIGAEKYDPLFGLSDVDGRVTFRVFSDRDTQYTLKAKVENQLLPRELTVTFKK
jgi:hypothetical protein